MKEKIQVVLNQKGQFKCPNGADKPKSPAPAAVNETPEQSLPTSSTNRLSLIIADLKKRETSRPATVKTLSSTINALFQKKLDENEVSTLLSQLQAKGWVVVDGTKVSYVLPTKDF